MNDLFSIKYKELCGAIHLHTHYSDGGTSLSDMISAANTVGLDYIVITDHMTLQSLKDGHEGTHKNTAVIIGYEHQDPENHNHYLAIGTDTVFEHLTQPQNYIDAVKQSGGIGFIAHPTEKRNYMPTFPPYPWTDWSATNYDGIEVWNQMSEWMENLKSWKSILNLFYPRRFLYTAPEDSLNLWDKLNKERFVSGIGGVDAHTKRIGKGLFSYVIFPIKVELKGIRTHLFVQNNDELCNFKTLKSSILTALKNGNGFISNFRRGDARGTTIFLSDKNNEFLLPGNNPCVNTPSVLKVTVPSAAEIHLIKNGQKISSVHSTKAEFIITEKGLYRIMVTKKSKAWIYSNPFPVGSYPF
jgi:predicted metal-dependent phosphoesterase TrpH